MQCVQKVHLLYGCLGCHTQCNYKPLSSEKEAKGRCDSEVSQYLLAYWLFSLVFHANNSRTQQFQENRLFKNNAYIALKPLVFGRLVACSARIVVTDRHTHTRDNYYNPRCACAPRVNDMYYITQYGSTVYIGMAMGCSAL